MTLFCAFFPSKTAHASSPQIKEFHQGRFEYKRWLFPFSSLPHVYQEWENYTETKQFTQPPEITGFVLF